MRKIIVGWFSDTLQAIIPMMVVPLMLWDENMNEYALQMIQQEPVTFTASLLLIAALFASSNLVVEAIGNLIKRATNERKKKAAATAE